LPEKEINSIKPRITRWQVFCLHELPYAGKQVIR